MSKSKHTEAQMIAALKQLEAGRKVEDVARDPAHIACRIVCVTMQSPCGIRLRSTLPLSSGSPPPAMRQHRQRRRTSMNRAGFSVTASRCWKLPCVVSMSCGATQPRLVSQYHAIHRFSDSGLPPRAPHPRPRRTVHPRPRCHRCISPTPSPTHRPTRQAQQQSPARTAPGKKIDTTHLDESPRLQCVLADCRILCHTCLPMTVRAPRELLEELRTYLQHFDQTGHLGESASVAEIKRRLRARIVEAEAELERSGTSEPRL